MVSVEDRYAPVRLLREYNISSILWGEDALRFLGVKTVLFKLHLLVPDPAAAAQALVLSKQYAIVPPANPSDFLENSDIKGRAVRVSPTALAPNIGTDQVVLLKASTWYNFPLPKLSANDLKDANWMYHHIPTLPLFVDHLLSTWLLSPWSDGKLGQTWFDVSIWVSYIYGAGLPELTYPTQTKSSRSGGREDAKDFALNLGPGARELHIAMAKLEINWLAAPEWKKYNKILVDSRKK